jgi:hypothetical protein
VAATEGGKKVGNRALRALTSGALALPGLAGSAQADGAGDLFALEYAFSWYQEDDIDSSLVAPGGETERMTIQSHQIHLDKPWSGRVDLDFDLMHEVMSGASPIFVEPGPGGEPQQVMSGATIEEQRTDFSTAINVYFDTGQMTGAAGVSTENDYLAISGGLEGVKHFNEKNTSVSMGGGFSFDKITPVDTKDNPLRPEKETRQGYDVFVGVSQIINEFAIVDSTVSYQRGNGFLSDPYKEVFVAGNRVADSRPEARNGFSWLTRYRHHVDLLKGSVHADYRLYLDDWGITSHTLEVAWAQSLWDVVQVIPSVRYYSQSQADFYAPYFDTATDDGNASSDYRLSPFGAISWGVRAETQFPTGQIQWRGRISYERYDSDASYALGKVDTPNPGLVSFNVISFSLLGAF